MLAPELGATSRRGPARHGSGRSTIARQAPPRIKSARLKSSRTKGTKTKTASRSKRRGRKARVPVVSPAQRELAQDMARDAYALGRGLAPAQRVSLLTRLLYTLRPEAMASEKRRWAEELFELARRLPAEGPGSGASRFGVPSAPAVGELGSNPGGPGASAVGAVEPQPGLPGTPAVAALGSNGAAIRNQAIATAAARLAIYDSDRALELLDKLPSQRGRREDARTMAARLLFPIYLRQHGAAGAQTLLAHPAEWGEHGGFPYAASAAALARLRGDEQAAEDFFRQALAVFERGNEGPFGIAEFGELLERAAAMEAISEDAAEDAGRAIVAQAAKLARAGGDAVESELLPEPNSAEAQNRANGGGLQTGRLDPTPDALQGNRSNTFGQSALTPALTPALTEEARQRLAAALNYVRLAAPKAYAQAAKNWPALAGLRAVHVVSPVQELKVDTGLQASFAELGATIAEHRGPEALSEVIQRGLERVNARYRAGACSACLAPDAQSSAFVALAAYGSPWTIGTQLKVIEEPFWRAYFLAIAAQKVGEPTRVADPTSRRVLQKEEAEPEDEEEAE